MMRDEWRLLGYGLLAAALMAGVLGASFALDNVPAQWIGAAIAGAAVLAVYLIARRREAPAWRRAWNSVDDPGALNRFATARAAKDYLADRIVEEANRRQESISDLERRMLYFTEEDGDPSMLDLNDEFERQYDMDQYEAKISRLIKSGLDRTYRENKDELGVWYDAISTLAAGDHYLSVMTSMAGASPRGADKFASLSLKDFLPRDAEDWRWTLGMIVAAATLFCLLKLWTHRLLH